MQGLQRSQCIKVQLKRAMQWHVVSRVATINMVDVKVVIILSCSPMDTQNKGKISLTDIRSLDGSAKFPIDMNSLQPPGHFHCLNCTLPLKVD